MSYHEYHIDSSLGGKLPEWMACLGWAADSAGDDVQLLWLTLNGGRSFLSISVQLFFLGWLG